MCRTASLASVEFLAEASISPVLVAEVYKMCIFEPKSGPTVFFPPIRIFISLDLCKSGTVSLEILDKMRDWFVYGNVAQAVATSSSLRGGAPVLHWLHNVALSTKSGLLTEPDGLKNPDWQSVSQFG